MNAVVEIRSTVPVARARADRIRQGLQDWLETVQEIALAWERGDWEVLGYASWEAYVDEEIGRALRLTEVHRRQAVTALRLVACPPARSAPPSGSATPPPPGTSRLSQLRQTRSPLRSCRWTAASGQQPARPRPSSPTAGRGSALAAESGSRARRTPARAVVVPAPTGGPSQSQPTSATPTPTSTTRTSWPASASSTRPTRRRASRRSPRLRRSSCVVSTRSSRRARPTTTRCGSRSRAGELRRTTRRPVPSSPCAAGRRVTV
ncbi:hypothetical protein GA0074694_6215 [Micromonospora inyonensis]|uniref:Uncharacterized protein n=1 Tax=Micromonospora inyonensis TaxID=47866 RepID=A0A1C6SV38_9ACTN|nr:hypothetical protein GA0074694_6215 [Micromonospora inyonensis]